MLVESEKREMGGDVACLCVAPVPEGRTRCPFMAVGMYDGTARLLSLAPDTTLKVLSTQASNTGGRGVGFGGGAQLGSWAKCCGRLPGGGRRGGEGGQACPAGTWCGVLQCGDVCVQAGQQGRGKGACDCTGAVQRAGCCRLLQPSASCNLLV